MAKEREVGRIILILLTVFFLTASLSSTPKTQVQAIASVIIGILAIVFGIIAWKYDSIKKSLSHRSSR